MSAFDYSPFRPDGMNGFDTLVSEADFGWREIAGELNGIRTGLEIGAGPGLLSARVATATDAKITALEPSADGFSFSAPVLDAVGKAGLPNLAIVRQGIESFETNQRFDLIWSVNVFEHLPDWKAALAKTAALLAPGGKAVLLFPNYDFPYEPHFRIPIIGSPSLTRRLFKRRIETHEAKSGESGLWASLNFVTASELIRFGRETGLRIEIDRGMTARMFERLKDDGELQARQGGLRLPASAFRALRLHRLWAKLPARTQPYLRVNVSAAPHPDPTPASPQMESEKRGLR